MLSRGQVTVVRSPLWHEAKEERVKRALAMASYLIHVSLLLSNVTRARADILPGLVKEFKAFSESVGKLSGNRGEDRESMTRGKVVIIRPHIKDVLDMTWFRDEMLKSVREGKVFVGSAPFRNEELEFKKEECEEFKVKTIEVDCIQRKRRHK